MVKKLYGGIPVSEKELTKEEAEKLIINSFGLRKEFTKPIGWLVANG
jgi:hypothetical protein